ncbi:hypothetical protein OUZ56_007487 [Daphnia magna]|uniref:Uncharacterized protein n=1 Tax=Daphnia magna TaxID=35525 RepID=A0ABR0AAE9_9CRUS|nr:hypothetical protein OUZ56_007487 [Daphnia magna]
MNDVVKPNKREAKISDNRMSNFNAPKDSRPSLERFKEKATPSSRWLTIEIGGGQHNRQVKRNNNKTKMELASIAFWIDKSQTQKRIRRWNDKKLLISDRLF